MPQIAKGYEIVLTPDTMLVSRVSVSSRKEREMTLAITSEGLARWRSGELIQDVFPHLSIDEREFLRSGMTPEEWEAANAEGEENG